MKSPWLPSLRPPAEPVDDRSFYRPSNFEQATSWVHGVQPVTPIPHAGSPPRAAFEAAIRPALDPGPCFVSFSGGRDSSAVLAVATHIARTEGLPDPVPVTEVYPGIDDTDESEWQTMVVEHLGLTEWVRLRIHGDSDLLGTASRAGLRRRGLLWPPAVHVKEALLEAAAGGTLLTGEGGDEVIGARRVTPLTLLVRKRRPASRALLSASGTALLPRVLRRAGIRSEMTRDGQQQWLRHDVAQLHHRLLAADEAAEPLRWDRSTLWLRHRRAVRAVLGGYHALGAELGVRVIHPLLDDDFLAALAAAGGTWGYAGRTALMRRLFGDLLPDAILSRTSKASFDRAYMGEATREFAESWDGCGVDPDLVDPEALRRAWLSDEPSTLSGLLLQAAWLASRPATVTGGAA